VAALPLWLDASFPSVAGFFFFFLFFFFLAVCLMEVLLESAPGSPPVPAVWAEPFEGGGDSLLGESWARRAGVE
jgi:hypothetical protein